MIKQRPNTPAINQPTVDDACEDGERYGQTDGVPMGDNEYVHPATFLLMCSYLVHIASRADTGARADARQLLDGILTAARKGGFHRADLLETLMAKDERTDRLRGLAHAAVDAIGDTAAFLRVLRSAGANIGADQ